MIYATHLAKHDCAEEALKYLEDAQTLGKDYVHFDYNVGLIYFDLKDSENLIPYAHKDYTRGFSFPMMAQ